MKINGKILDFDIKNDLNVVIVHHYFAREFKKLEYWENDKIEITVRELEKRIGLSVNKIRLALDKLEEAGIIEVVKGGQRKPNTYKYIEQ